MKTREEIEDIAERFAQGDYHYHGKWGFVYGYERCKEDNKDKKYTEEDLRKAMITTMVSNSIKTSHDIDNYITEINK